MPSLARLPARYQIDHSFDQPLTSSLSAAAVPFPIERLLIKCSTGRRWFAPMLATKARSRGSQGPQAAIQGKEPQLAVYRLACDEIWLVMYPLALPSGASTWMLLLITALHRRLTTLSSLSPSLGQLALPTS
jgi:hypothetical protein